MGILDPLRRQPAVTETRYSWQDYIHDVMTFQGSQYRLGMSGSRPDVPTEGFEDYINKIHMHTGVVSAAVHQRASLISQLEPKWKRRTDDELFGTRSLRLLEQPAGGETMQQFFYRLELDASYAGSAYVVNDGGAVRRLRPDKCSVILGSDSDPDWDAESEMRVPYDAEVIGLVYHAGIGSSAMQVFMPGEFAIWSPEPDPVNFWRGISWVTSVVREVVADGQATDHQSKFFEHAGTPNLVFIMDPEKSPEETKEFAAITNKLHSGAQNAYKNMFLGGGTDVKVVGSTLESLSLKDITGGFENRVAIRSRIPAVILGTREGLSGSSLNAGNYNSARRMLADGWYAPHADGLMACLQRLFTPPSNAKLSWNRESVLFLQEDVADAADILSTKTSTIRTLIDGGFDPASVVEAISKGRLDALVHTGKLSVQLQPSEGLLDETPAEPAEPRSMVPAINVNIPDIHLPDVHLDSPHTNVHVDMESFGRDMIDAFSELRDGIQTQRPPEITVNVEPTPVTVNVEPTPVEVHNASPEIHVAAPEVNVPETHVQMTFPTIPPMKRRVRRDDKGRIAEIVEMLDDGS